MSKYFKNPVSNRLEDYKITKKKLKRCEVISQVGDKFILAVCKTSLGGILLIIDQHAADERIKLEGLLTRLTQISDSDSIILDTRYTIATNSEEYNLLEKHISWFAVFGIYYLLENKSVIITRAPQIICDKLKSFKDTFNRCSFIRDLLVGFVHDIREYRVAQNPLQKNFDWRTNLQNIPNELLDLFKSKACREAIMFGDSLNREQCTKLVKQLSKCTFPFQCAHGRPSVVPLVSFNSENRLTSQMFF